MINRRELLFNMVTLTIKSNVTGTITIDGQSFSQVKEASVRVKQGKVVSYSASSEGYESKSESVMMDSDKVVSVSLVSLYATFTINSNVSSTITINGDTSVGVTTKSANVLKGSNVNWSVSADEYTTQNGTESNVTSAVTKNVTLVYNGVTSICKARYIWCTDGSFVTPAKLSSSGKAAYGYALSSTTVVGIIKLDGLAWSPGSGPFYNATNAQSLTDGVANSNILKSISGFSSTNCPAIYYSCTQTNGGKTSYMPARDELKPLYNSIMKGNMKTDLTTAGIYTSCNYREATSSSSVGWNYVWSSSEYSEATAGAWIVNLVGDRSSAMKNQGQSVIPFFDFSS